VGGEIEKTEDHGSVEVGQPGRAYDEDVDTRESERIDEPDDEPKNDGIDHKHEKSHREEDKGERDEFQDWLDDAIDQGERDRRHDIGERMPLRDRRTGRRGFFCDDAKIRNEIVDEVKPRDIGQDVEHEALDEVSHEVILQLKRDFSD
jgi:hypothetical protein